MRCRAIGCRSLWLLAVMGLLLSVPSAAMAQAQAGVVVDAQGVLHARIYQDPDGRLMMQRIAAAKASLNPQVGRFSAMRMISLNRLEKAFAERGAVTDEMRYLAGLQRVKYVFLYPDTGDVVIAGPAEGWVTDLSGRVVGITSGRPAVQLQDLVVALRAYPPGQRGAGLIGCSIDPSAQGLADMQRFLQSLRPQPTNEFAQYVVTGLQASLGLQSVTINGVSPSTHFAQVMVEADYRMKLIGIGLEQPPVRLVSYVERANPAQVSANAMQRWYFMPDYECVRVSQDGLAMELVGDGVKLVGEDEVVLAGGVRKASSRGNMASQGFVADFTKKYPELADRSPVYAELRNLIDLAVAGAYIQQEEFYDKANWDMEVFGDEQKYTVETYSVPKTVETACNALWKGSRLMTPVGGGVTIHARRALESDNRLADENGRVAKLRNETTLKLAEGQWWWD